MLESLRPAEPDKILSLSGLVRADPRPGKMDLSIGVYRDASGRTPILATVREAEHRLYESEHTKTYVGPAGDAAFTAAVARVVFGDDGNARARGVQTPGGAGALRILAGLLARARPGATVWLPDPTWVNHESIVTDAALAVRRYPYFDPISGGVRFDPLLAALEAAPAGDIVLLHGCCHNPSGADLGPAQWATLADLIARRGLFPFVDLAYQGFGEGLEPDAAAVRLLVARVPELAVAVSCSKNFGIYRERTGAAFVIGASETQADAALSQLVVCARIAYSMPPDHGASIVRIILDDPALAARWRGELEAMRRAVESTRRKLAAAFRAASGGDRYDFLLRHRGMFSLLGVDAAQVERLRREHAIYMVADGRANLAGLREDQIGSFVSAVLAVRG